MWHPFEAATVSAVFTTESRQKNEAIFSRTHTPMGRVLVSHNRVGLGNGQFVGEQEILSLIQSSAPLDSNRVWFVVGETGSGKSELCQWLEYHLRDRHLPLHIARRQANLTGILEVLAPHLPFDVVGDTRSIPLPILAGHLQTQLLLRAHRERRHQAYIEALTPFLPGIAAHLYSGAPDALRLPPDAPPAPEGLPLTAWLSGAAREALGVQSLEPALRALAESAAARGRRPVLLLEDITTLGFLRDDLLDYIFDLSAPGFDAVIGLTSGFEQSHLAGGDLSDMAYVRDRLSARFQLSHESGETFFLSQPRDLHDLVRRYLGCLPPQDSVPQDHLDAFDGLYPLTPTMLERLYLHLVESGNARQTPRNLLDAVIRPALSLRDPPHVTCFRPHPYLKAPSTLFYRDGLSEEQAALYYWHGEVRGGHVHVPPAVAAAFGFPGLPAIQAFVQPAGSSNLYTSKREDPAADWREALRELQQWHAQGTPFPKRQHLKRGITKILRALFDPRALQHPHLHSLSADPLTFARGGEHLPIYLPDSGDLRPPGTPCLELGRNLPAQFFEECLTYAFTSGQHAECFSDPAYTQEILGVAVEAFGSSLQDHLARLLGQPLEPFVFGLWWLCQHVCQAQVIDARTPEGLRALLKYDLTAADGAAWQAERPHTILHRTHRAILEGREAYRDLFISVFHHRDDLIDPERLEKHARAFDPALFLAGLADVSLGPLTRVSYRQSRSKRSLHVLVKPMVEYAAALRNYASGEDDLARWETLSDTLDHALEQGEQIDTVCRALEQATHRLAWSVAAPPGSHQWHSPRWPDVAAHSRRERGHVGHSAPLLRITVARTWRERLEGLEPLLWMDRVTAYHNAITGMLREHGLGRTGDRLSAGTVTLTHLQALLVRLDGAAALTHAMPREVASQVMDAVQVWVHRNGPMVDALRQEHGLSDLSTLSLSSRDQALIFLSDLLRQAAITGR